MLLKAHLGQIFLFLTVHKSGPLILGVFGCLLLFCAFLRGHFPFLKLLPWPLFLQIGNGV